MPKPSLPNAETPPALLDRGSGRVTRSEDQRGVSAPMVWRVGRRNKRPRQTRERDRRRGLRRYGITAFLTKAR
jgi:hypothetical protein